MVHFRKNQVMDFARQIFKWAKAKVAIIKKHGMDGLVSHVYLWPMYVLIGFIAGFILFFLLGWMPVFFWLFAIGVLLYIVVVFGESVRLTRKFSNSRLLMYSLGLIPIVHISYFGGVFAALVKRKIW